MLTLDAEAEATEAYETADWDHDLLADDAESEAECAKTDAAEEAEEARDEAEDEA